MHAIRQHEFGPPETLRYEEIDDPKPGPHQVRIAVRAAGVHVIDTTIRAGGDAGQFPLPDLPMTPGREVAGVVDGVGPEVDEEWLGRRVVAHLGFANGGYAELAVREVDAVHPVPGGVTDQEAVAMIGTGRTTMAILELADLSSDDTVLVTAAAGGIGTLLVQAGRNAGATVVGAAGGAAKVDLVRELGADLAVDYTRPRWVDAVREALGDRPVTVTFDSVGGELGMRSVELLAPGGRVILYGASSGAWTELTTADLLARGLTASAAVGPRIMQRPGGMRDLEERALAAVADGVLRPRTHAFPLSRAADAHAALAARATVGKVVLIP